MNNRKMTAGIDIGTTTISAVVMKEKQVITSRTVASESFLPSEREWEKMQDVSVIVKKAKEVLDELLDQYPEIVSIGLTGQQHGILYLDGDGRCVSPLYTWQDTRADLPAEDGRSIVERVRKVSSSSAASGYGLLTFLSMKENELIPDEAEALCTVPDYFGMVLTGRKKVLMHGSMAGSIGFFDVEKKVFEKEAFLLAGGEESFLPEVTSKVRAIGNYRGCTVAVAVGDNQASFLGSVGLQENTILLNMGTGGQISVLSDRKFEAEGIETRMLDENHYLLVGASLCGGRAYAILEHFFREYSKAAGFGGKSQYEIMETLARMAETGETETMKVDTRFKGTRNNPGIRGSITGLNEENFTPAGLVRGVLHGMADELYDLFCLIQDGTGIQAGRMIASGNGVRKNEVLQRILKETFRTEVTMAPYQEEAACGAAAAAELLHLS